jgi:hypothetical protein
MFEFDTCVGCGELPISISVISISNVLPSFDFVDEVCLPGMRRSRDWDERTPSSDSAISSQLCAEPVKAGSLVKVIIPTIGGNDNFQHLTQRQKLNKFAFFRDVQLLHHSKNSDD